MKKTTFLLISISIIGLLSIVVSETNALSRTATTLREIEPISLDKPTQPIITTTRPIVVEPAPVSPPNIIIREEIIRWPTLNLSTTRLPSPSGFNSCVTPTPGMVITTDTTLCAGGVYTNTAAATTFITIDADNVTLDCQGSELADGTASHFNDGVIVMPERDNVTVQNCVFRNMFNSIVAGSLNLALDPIDNLIVQNNTFINEVPYWNNMLLQNVRDSEIAYNVRSDANNDSSTLPAWYNSTFMNLWEGSNNNIHHNTVHNVHGLHLSFASHNNTVQHNTITFIGQGIHLGGENYSLPGGIELDRAASDNSIHDNIITPTGITSAMGIVLHGYGASDLSGAPKYMVAAHNNSIKNNHVSLINSVYAGIAVMHAADNNTIDDNLLEINGTNSTYGIYQQYGTINTTNYFPHHNSVINNTITCGQSYTSAIAIANGTDSATIDSNTVDDCSDGFLGAYAPDSEYPQVPITNTTITNNTISNSYSSGIRFFPHTGAHEDTTVTKNYLYQNGWYNGNLWFAGLSLGPGINTMVIGNSFIENGKDQSGTFHQLSVGAETVLDQNDRGNYYSDFDEPSEGCNDVDQNFICDSPYVINSGAGIEDGFPFTSQGAVNNQPPTIQPIEPIVINELGYAAITIRATDPDGDTLTYSVDDERFRSMDGCWPGRNAFAWFTNEYSAGSYIVNAIVSDGFYEVSQPVSVTVRNTCQINKWGEMVCTSGHSALYCY